MTPNGDLFIFSNQEESVTGPLSGCLGVSFVFLSIDAWTEAAVASPFLLYHDYQSGSNPIGTIMP